MLTHLHDDHHLVVENAVKCCLEQVGVAGVWYLIVNCENIAKNVLRKLSSRPTLLHTLSTVNNVSNCSSVVVLYASFTLV